VYLAELFQTLVSARENGKSACMDLTVQYRGSIDHQAIFLIKKYTKIIVQFRVAEEFLLTKNIHFESWMNTDKIRKQIAKQNCNPNLSTLIQDLRHGMKKVTVEAEVLETPKPSIVQTRYGNSARVTNALIADETGKIKLCLWNEQANFITTGNTIQIKNASVCAFKGERQLRLGKNGTINILQSQTARTKQQPETIAKNTIYA
jgi:replication factor A1